MLISHNGNTDLIHFNIFKAYEIENTTLNGRAHYTSDDGGRAIWYGDCGLWVVGPPDNRLAYTIAPGFFKYNVKIIILSRRGTCSVYAYTQEDLECPSNTGQTWKYHDGNSWVNAGEGLLMNCYTSN